MFKAAGTVMCRIDEIKFADPKFCEPEEGFDICVHGTSMDDPSQGDWWRGEMSNKYGKGNFATMTQAQITMKTLRNLGFEGDEMASIKTQLLNKENVPFHIKETEAKDGSGKIFYNVQYIGEGGGDQPKEIDDATVQNRLAALFGGGAPAPAPAPAPQPAAQAPNPFAKPQGQAGAPAAAPTTGKAPF